MWSRWQSDLLIALRHNVAVRLNPVAGMAIILPALLAMTPAAVSAQQPGPPVPPTPDQTSMQLCDINRVQGEKNAGAIISSNLTAIDALQKEVATLKAERDKLKADASKPSPAK